MYFTNADKSPQEKMLQLTDLIRFFKFMRVFKSLIQQFNVSSSALLCRYSPA